MVVTLTLIYSTYKLAIMKASLMIIKDAIIKKSVYKREYYLKKTILFEEKFDFNFSDEGLKEIDEVFLQMK